MALYVGAPLSLSLPSLSPGPVSTGLSLCPALQIMFISAIFLVVQLLSRVRLFVTPWAAACQVSLALTISRSLRKLMCILLESI